MKITRTINNETIEIELTAEELRKAYDEKQREYYREDLEYRYDLSNLDEEEIEDLITEVVDEMSNYNGGDDYWGAIEYATRFFDVIEKEEY